MIRLTERFTELAARDAASKDLVTFLSIHAKGNILHLGLCDDARGAVALLYGLSQRGGHLWTVSPWESELQSFTEHDQWTLIPGDPQDVTFIRSGGVPEEIDLMFLNPEPDRIDTMLALKLWGPCVKTTGLIIVYGVRKNRGVQEACADYAKSYGMKFHIRQADADLGVIFSPDNKEALKL